MKKIFISVLLLLSFVSSASCEDNYDITEDYKVGIGYLSQCKNESAFCEGYLLEV